MITFTEICQALLELRLVPTSEVYRIVFFFFLDGML